MTGIWAASRRRILTPSTSQTKLARRGFHEKSPEATEQLEAAGAMFLAGYAHAAEAKQAWEAETRAADGAAGVPRFRVRGRRHGLRRAGRHRARAAGT